MSSFHIDSAAAHTLCTCVGAGTVSLDGCTLDDGAWVALHAGAFSVLQLGIREGGDAQQTFMRRVLMFAAAARRGGFAVHVHGRGVDISLSDIAALAANRTAVWLRQSSCASAPMLCGS